MSSAGHKLPPRRIDLTGQRFGMLTVVGFLDLLGHTARWSCVCDCGSTAAVPGYRMRSGHTRSCGCMRRGDWNRRGNLTHGHNAGHDDRGKRIATVEYRTWSSMIQRCTNPRARNYKHYGGRGITVCARWRDSFEAFLADMGPRPAKLSIDRINVNGNYEPGNCRWATQIEQVRNQRPRSRRV